MNEPKQKERCCFRPFERNGVPSGPQCQQFATLRIEWNDGRFSYGCAKHGLRVLHPEAQKLVESVQILESAEESKP